MSEKKSEKISNLGGKREGAGRKKGSPNKKTAELQQKVAETGLTPLEVMLQIMRNTSDERLQLTAAQAAAPYVHAKLSSVELTGDMKVTNVRDLSDDELAAIAASGGK